MKKLILSLLLLISPIVFCFGQVSVSGVTGSDGYSVLRSSLQTDVFFIPGLSFTPGYSVYQKDGMKSMSQYSLGANFKLPIIDLIEVGASGGYIPRSNDYSSYFYDVNASVNAETLFFRLLPTDELRIGGGVKNTYHSFYDPDYKVDETDAYGFISQQTGGFDTSVNFTKAISYSKDLTGTVPPWMDVKNFTAVYSGYLDYSVGANAGYTYKFIRPYASYNFLKTKNTDFSTDNARAGVIVKVFMIDFNAAMEWFNFTRNTAERKSFFSLSAGMKFL